MVSILSDEVLNKLLCSICKKYLSCQPTKIQPDGKISCGRCNKNETGSPNSFYETVAKDFLFPCVNRYEGCNKLLRYQDVAEHEKSCRGIIVFLCPLCPAQQSTLGSLLNVIDHFKTQHEKFILKEPKLSVESKEMSHDSFLYWDNSVNCLLFINVECVCDKVLMNVRISAKNRAIFKVIGNNKVIEERTVKRDDCFQQFEINISEILNKGDSSVILFEFNYEVIEKNLPVVVTDFNSEGDRKTKNLNKLPTIYLDDYLFPGDKKYRLSNCRSKLVSEQDSEFNIKLKCDSCKTYFWNVSRWRPVVFDPNSSWNFYKYCLYRREAEELNDLICFLCFKNVCSEKLCKPVTTANILKLKFHCRYDCGIICFVWELRKHEDSCDFNLERDPGKFVKKSFGLDVYNDDDLFIRGNVIASFRFEVAFYSSAVFGPCPKIPHWRDIISPERTIYCVTDDGLRCKVNYKYDKGHFYVLVDHEYDRSRYFVTIFSKDSPNFNLSEITYSENSQYFDLGLYDPKVEQKSDGSSLAIQTPFFIINLKKVRSNCNVIL